MTVPASGTLTFRGLSRECIYGDYNSASTPSGCVELEDMLTGGQPCSPSPTYPEVNDDCSPNPGTTTGNNLISEWYSYDKDCVPLTGFGCSDCGQFNKRGSACDLTGSNYYYHDGSSTYPSLNDTVYTSSAGTTTVPNCGGQTFAWWRANPTGSAGAFKTEDGVVTQLQVC